MRRDEIKVGQIYGNGSSRYRIVNDIMFDEGDGEIHINYEPVGSLLIKGAIHRIPTAKSSCRIETFAKWALYGMDAETFIYIRKRAEKEVKEG